MHKQDLEKAFRKTPQAYRDVIHSTLHSIREEEPMKKFTLRTVLMIALIALLSIGLVYAAITWGQQYYFDSRFNIKEHNEGLYTEIIDNLKEVSTLENIGDAAQHVDVQMKDYAIANDNGRFTLSLSSSPKNPEKVELHALMELDADGFEDDREEHWLWTTKGFGLPKDVMFHPEKTLMLIGFMEYGNSVWIGDTRVSMPLSSYDVFTNEDGNVFLYAEMNLKELDEAAIEESFAPKNGEEPAKADGLYPVLEVGSNGEGVRYLHHSLAKLGVYNGPISAAYDEETLICVKAFQNANGLEANGIADSKTQEALYEQAKRIPDEVQDNSEALHAARERAKAINAALAESVSEDGLLKLRIPYIIQTLADGELSEESNGEISFEVKWK